MTYLKNVLRVNAISSGATALLLIIFSEFTAGLFGTSQTTPFIEVGVFLLLFAAFVYFQSRKDPLQPGKIKWIIALDVTWVIGSLAIILPQLFGLSALGYLLIGGVALWVAAMAWLQSNGLNKLQMV